MACSTGDVRRSRSRRLARTRKAQAANGGPLPDARSLPIARDNRFSHRCRPRRPRKTTPGFVTLTGSQRLPPHAICAIEPMMLQTSKRSATVVHSLWEAAVLRVSSGDVTPIFPGGKHRGFLFLSVVRDRHTAQPRCACRFNISSMMPSWSGHCPTSLLPLLISLWPICVLPS